MDDKKFIIGIIVSTVAIIVGGIFLATKIAKTPQVEANKNAKAQVNKKAHDWRTIGLNDGNVEAIFDIENTGQESLKLFNVKTSCMCTIANLILDDTVSSDFGMHSKSSFVFDVPSGKTAQLKVTFDPAFHGPSGVGPITRQVDVATNDPDNPELSFILTATVTR